jgi:pimeloyl-ACP methyl ester carboxylesterase
MRWFFGALLAVSALAQTPSGTNPVKPVPAIGIEVSGEDRAELESGLARLHAAAGRLQKNPLLPDVMIYHEAVRYALQYREFFKPAEIVAAKLLLKQGEERAAQLEAGQAPWTTATGLVVRGYVSKIDRSVQPYGLVMPPSFSPTAPHRWRLDAWFHGRDEALSEVNFLTGRQKSAGEFMPRDGIVLHLYGRFCNANRFAGETDLFEAMEAVKKQYAIDENRIFIRGFSMGGASAWQFGAHFAGLWAAVAPGAGFTETKEFLKLQELPVPWEQKLWHLYDSADYAANLYNVPVIEYHGEIDPQQQAGDVMERAMAAEGLRLVRIVGPQTPHRYHPDAKVEIERRLEAIAARGRDPLPRTVKFTTWTLAYNRMGWVTVDGLAQHWERARVEAELAGASAVNVTSANVTALTLEMGAGLAPLDVAHAVSIAIDGQKVSVPGPGSDRSWSVHLRKTGTQWGVAPTPDSTPTAGLHKVHGLQGPIDDAFMDSFVFVTPTGTPIAPGVAGWVGSEQKRAIAEWRRQFRGEAQVREDKDVTDAEIASSNLVLWGDPGSNRILAKIILGKIAGGLPVQWSAQGLVVNGVRYAAETHVPVLVFPNPLNPKKYVVLNSGFTYREFDYLNNARQSPKLPDWAVIDTSVAPGPRYAGKVVTAGFFNEEWK